MHKNTWMILVLLAVPMTSQAEDTRCTTDIEEIKTVSVEPMPGSLDPIDGELLIKGTAFGGTYVPLCHLGAHTRTDGNAQPGTVPVTSAGQCDRWLTAAELAMALDMTVVLGYDALSQQGCDKLNDKVYPYYLEVHENAPAG